MAVDDDSRATNHRKVMKTIWKFSFDVDGEATIEMPHGAQVLHVGSQAPRTITVWAMVILPAEIEHRTFYVKGTGEVITEDDDLRYLGTVMDDPWVWHVFEPEHYNLPGAEIANRLVVEEKATVSGTGMVCTPEE